MAYDNSNPWAGLYIDPKLIERAQGGPVKKEQSYKDLTEDENGYARRQFEDGSIGYEMAPGYWASQTELNQRLKSGTNPDGTPMRPKYESWLDPKTGLLKDQFQMKSEGIDMNSLSGLSALKGEATRQGPSQWAQMMLMRQNQDRASGLNQAAAGANQALAQGRSSLAMRGGLSAGARERLASQSARDLMASRQGVNQQATQSRYNLLGQDEQNRLGMLGQFSQAEAGLAQFNKGNELKQNEFNLMKAMEEKRAKEAYDQNIYNQGLQKYGAEKQAAATEKAGQNSGGSWVCTKIHIASPLSIETKSALFKLKKFSLKNHPSLAQCYIYRCAELVDRMDADGIDWAQMKWFTNKITDLVRAGDLERAFNYYVGVITHYANKYWPDTEDPVLSKLINKNELQEVIGG